MAEENLRVAVRVRPFNQREKDANASLCVAMSGNQTIITNPKTKDEKKYAYDFSYWYVDLLYLI
jgi:kinesin family protein 1